MVRLSYNSLTRFESIVFEPLLEKMVLKNASVDIWSSKYKTLQLLLWVVLKNVIK